MSLLLCIGIISERLVADSVRCDEGRVLTIDDLPDDDLLAIFDFYVVKSYQRLGFGMLDGLSIRRKTESWQSLVHVCRRWRCLVFASPRRLNLQLYYEPEKSARTRKSLDVWPALPLLVKGQVSESSVYNVIAALKHNDRIRQINLGIYFRTTPPIDGLWTAMEVPFPELVALTLSLLSFSSVLHDSFLGGSAPRLRYLCLHAIPFPGLPKLLLTATHLVELHLHNIPHSGYISPEAMATCLSMLTSLEELELEFKSLRSYPGPRSRRPFPPTRSALPTLTIFSFKGLNEYLEEFVARIDAPQLYRLSTTLFNDIDFSTSELNQFIGRTQTFGAYDEAHLIFPSYSALVRLRQSHPEPSDRRMLEVKISGQGRGRQLSTLAQICTLSLRLLLAVENLYIDASPSSPFVWGDDAIENTEWLDLLLPFTAVKNLHLSAPISPQIALVLQELTGGRIAEVLPALQNIFLEGLQPSEPVQKGIARFIFARPLRNYRVAISVWHGELESCGTTVTWRRLMLDCYPSSFSLMFRVAVIFFSFVIALLKLWKKHRIGTR